MIVKCDDCGRDISDRAKACPHCGAPTSRVNKVVKEASIRFTHASCDFSKFIFRKSVPILVLGFLSLLWYWMMSLYKDRTVTLATMEACLAISNSLVGGVLFLLVVKRAWGDMAFKVIGWIAFTLQSMLLPVLVAPAVLTADWDLLLIMLVLALFPIILIFNWLRTDTNSNAERLGDENHSPEPKEQEVNKSLEVQGLDDDKRKNGDGVVKNGGNKSLGCILSFFAVLIGVLMLLGGLQVASDRRLMRETRLKYAPSSNETCIPKPQMEDAILQDMDDCILTDVCNYWKLLSSNHNSAISVEEIKGEDGRRINKTITLYLDCVPHLRNKNAAYFKKILDFCREKIGGYEMEKNGVHRFYKDGAGVLVSCLDDERTIKVVLPKSIVVSEGCFYEPEMRRDENRRENRRRDTRFRY